MVDEAVRHHDQLLGESDSVNYDIRTLQATIHKMNHQVETEQAKEQEISQRMRQMKEQTNGEIRQITESISQLQRVVVDDSDSKHWLRKAEFNRRELLRLKNELQTKRQTDSATQALDPEYGSVIKALVGTANSEDLPQPLDEVMVRQRLEIALANMRRKVEEAQVPDDGVAENFLRNCIHFVLVMLTLNLAMILIESKKIEF